MGAWIKWLPSCRTNCKRHLIERNWLNFGWMSIDLLYLADDRSAISSIKGFMSWGRRGYGNKCCTKFLQRQMTVLGQGVFIKDFIKLYFVVTLHDITHEIKHTRNEGRTSVSIYFVLWWWWRKLRYLVPEAVFRWMQLLIVFLYTWNAFLLNLAEGW